LVKKLDFYPDTESDPEFPVPLNLDRELPVKSDPDSKKIFLDTSFNLETSVADPHHFDADPDPALHFDADPEPDPDPGSESYCQLGMVKKKFSILVNNKTQMG